jgi:hypothetical protein
MRGPEVPDLFGSNDKASTLSSWSPTIPFRNSLEDVYRFWFDKLSAEKTSAAKAS